MNAVCGTPGTYTSFGSCESILTNSFESILIFSKVVQKDAQNVPMLQPVNYVNQTIIKVEQLVQNALKVNMLRLLRAAQVSLSITLCNLNTKP